jgi:cytidylate kinase
LTDVHHYDLVLNTEKFSIGQAADLIIAALKTLEHRASGQ